ncbi:MAG: 4-hydroxy-tetrahydrodipicolinate synthase, partial [Ignavibacteriae bacterium]|nr:4-hydroxy-tetrahydrodipicolinate synthase [Ignavibacteriota bacterium]
MQQQFRGIYTALVTPFSEDGSVDVKALKNLVDDQIEAGVHGIVAVASTGEGATLDETDHCLVVDTCIEQANGRTLVIAGAGSNNTKRAVHLQKLMQKRGVAATLHVTPFYNKPTPEGMYQHFKAVAEATDLPLLLYNVPGRTGIDIQPATVLRLATDYKNIIGMKDA